MVSFAAVSGWALVGAMIALALRPVAARLVSDVAPARGWLAPGIAELLTSAIFAALAYRIGPRVDLLAFSALAATGVLLAVTDLVARKLPNVLVAAAYATVLPLFALSAVLNDKLDHFVRALLGMGAVLAVHAILYAVRAIAGGDLKIVGVLGASLGWISWSATWTGLAFGWLLAGSTALISRAFARKHRRADVPLGPFLIAGAMVVVVASSSTAW